MARTIVLLWCLLISTAVVSYHNHFPWKGAALSKLKILRQRRVLSVNVASPAVSNPDVVAQLQQYTQSSDDNQLIANTALLVSAGLAYTLYQNRPRGEARNELLQVRKSANIARNLGVHARTFIPKETVLGRFPGYIRDINSFVLHSKAACT